MFVMTIHPFIVFVCVYALLEFVYLSVSATLYKTHFAKLQGIPLSKVNLQMVPWGIVCYIIVFVALWYFVVYDVFYGPKDLKVIDLLKRATLLALAVYGVYNLTNAATLANYSMRVLFQDIAWGVFAMNAVTLICFWINKYSIK
jgi:uncharacterized membrane protein